MSAALTLEHLVALEEIRAGRVVWDFGVPSHYVRDGVPLDFWQVAPFDELVLDGHVRRNGSGKPLEVTR